jgi:predicted dehydrogenase
MADRLRCAVIGTGSIGVQHLTSLTTCPRAAAVALSETHPQRARETSERFKIPRIYSDYRELLEQPDIDAVIVSVPNNMHATMAIEALQARKHVLLEKPMALNYKEALKIVEVARKMRRLLMVGYHFRFNRHTQTVRALVDRGEAGEIYHAKAFWLRRSGIPRIGSWFTKSKMSGGGCTADIACHMLDTALHLLKDFDVLSVTAQTYAKFGPRGLGEFDWGKSEIDPKRTFDVEDYSVALLRLKHGRTVLLESSWAGFHPHDAREFGVDLLGSNAGLSLFPARMFRNGPTGYETVHLEIPTVPHSENRIHHFVSCVLEGKRPLVTMEESLKVQQVLDGIYLSATTGKEVRIKENGEKTTPPASGK